MTTPPGGEGQPPPDPDRDPYTNPPPADSGQYYAQQPPPPPGYGQPPAHGQGGYAQPPDHPRATTSLILGILGVVLCQVIAPFAWSIGKSTVNEIDASGGRLGGRGTAQAGYIMGIVGTVLLGIALVFLVIWIIFAVAVIGGSTTYNN